MSELVRFLQTPTAQLVIWLAVTAIFIAVGVWIVRTCRDRAEEDESVTSDCLTKFRDLHSRGDLSDTEFRTIKTVLAQQLQQELKDNSDEG